MNDLAIRVLKRNPQSVCLGCSTLNKPDAEYQYADVLLRDGERVVMARQAHDIITHQVVDYDDYLARARKELGIGT